MFHYYHPFHLSFGKIETTARGTKRDHKVELKVEAKHTGQLVPPPHPTQMMVMLLIGVIGC
jgi:hypothetical protein